jgi:hypothetical protein
MDERGFKQLNSGGRYWNGIRLIDTNRTSAKAFTFSDRDAAGKSDPLFDDQTDQLLVSSSS